MTTDEADTKLPRAPYPLTRRQMQVVVGMGRGYNIQEIARLLHLSPKTVDHHLEQAYRRLGVHSYGQAIYKLSRTGWLGIPVDQGRGLTNFQRAYLEAFDSYLQSKSDDDWTKMRAAFIGIRIEHGIRRRVVPSPDPLDRLLATIAAFTLIQGDDDP